MAVHAQAQHDHVQPTGPLECHREARTLHRKLRHFGVEPLDRADPGNRGPVAIEEGVVRAVVVALPAVLVDGERLDRREVDATVVDALAQLVIHGDR
jgi:hypothetical protein